jgi:phosphoribosylamine--glycine ligase
MRFLGIGEYCDLAALYLRLVEEGHEVKVSIANPFCQGTLAGMVEHVADWRNALDWIKSAGLEGMLLFENVAHGSGELQDALRADGFNVVGGSAFGDRLENDRAFAQRVLAQAGLAIARHWEFQDAKSACEFLKKNQRRCVLKFNGPEAAIDNYVGRLHDGSDVQTFLERLAASKPIATSLVLMEYIDGIEMGVGAYFDGERFLHPACLDWEHKRFFPGDLGELTGEMGTVVTYARSRHFFERTLLPIERLLREHRHRGYVNLNTIVNQDGIWPLEFTCRFGYPGFAILTPLQQTPWEQLLAAMAGRRSDAFKTGPGFCVGIVLTVPPFPYPRSQVNEPVGLPVVFEGELSSENRANLHYCELGLEGGALVTSGIYGWAMVVTGTGESIALAQERANRLADRVLIPNVRYRRDIGARLIDGDYARVEALGLLDPV